MKTFLLALVATCGFALFYSVAWAWQTNISGTELGSGWADAVSVDGAGNVVAAGIRSYTDRPWDFTVVKLGGTDGSDF